MTEYPDSFYYMLAIVWPLFSGMLLLYYLIRNVLGHALQMLDMIGR